MKKKSIWVYSTLIITLIIGLLLFNALSQSHSKMTQLRQQHAAFLENSPFKETLKLTKKERKANRLPPNKYAERLWELTMNPALGKPEPEKLLKLQEQLKNRALFAKVPGENDNIWQERGPNNIGGRTRAIMFDPNDTTHKRVFAGGVSGGLWVNDDITNTDSSWTEVNIPQNLAISCITYDPNNTMTFYIGTGESYINGRVNGNGVWKSTDGGANWSRIFGGTTGETTFVTNTKLIVNSPGSIAGDYQITTANFGSQLTSVSGNLVLVNDGVDTTTDGCTAPTNNQALNGNIAVIERGSCNFTIKVKHAQNAGAIAVLIVNNVTGAPVNLNGNDGTITIPSGMISKDEGTSIIAQLASTVNVTMQTSPSFVPNTYSTPGIHHINDIKIRDIGSGNSEIYVAAASSRYRDATPLSVFGLEDYGLYRSSTNGNSWAKLNLPTTPQGSPYAPNDIEIATDNTVWVATTNNYHHHGGGTVLFSEDGANYTVKKTVTYGDRAQIAMFSSNPDGLYMLTELSPPAPQSGEPEPNRVAIISTDDGFSTETTLALPNDVDTGIPATDFTRGQAFYDLLLEVDPANDAILYVGGIDLFRSSNSGTSWTQISKWSNNNNLGGLNVPRVHADQHALVFHPTDATKAIIGNDGGVYYANALNTMPPEIESRNNNYNTVQFYSADIGQETNVDKIIAGAQDNGTLFTNASSDVNGFSDINNGGDGAQVFIDKDNEYMIASYVYNTYSYKSYSNGSHQYSIVSDQYSGDFINPAALNSADNYLFTNGTFFDTSIGITYQVNRYKLGTNSATATSITNELLDRSPTAFRVSPYTSSTIMVGTETGKLLKIENATSENPSWTNITGPEFYGSISCIAFGASNDEIFVTFYNYGVTSIFYSDDGGASWDNKEGNLPDLPVRAIMMNPLKANEVIIGTDLGVWGTPNFNDATPNWNQTNNGMKDVPVHSFNLRTADNTVLAATYGRGVFTGQFTNENSSLSTQTPDSKNIASIYPTISHGTFYITANKTITSGKLYAFNMSGQEVYRTKVHFNHVQTQTITLNDLSSGFYIVKFVSGNKSLTRKIIIE